MGGGTFQNQSDQNQLDARNFKDFSTFCSRIESIVRKLFEAAVAEDLLDVPSEQTSNAPSLTPLHVFPNEFLGDGPISFEESKDIRSHKGKIMYQVTVKGAQNGIFPARNIAHPTSVAGRTSLMFACEQCDGRLDTLITMLLDRGARSDAFDEVRMYCADMTQKTAWW